MRREVLIGSHRILSRRRGSSPCLLVLAPSIQGDQYIRFMNQKFKSIARVFSCVC